MYMQLLLNTCYITIYNFSFRQAIGPIIGGALTEMMDFQTSAVVRFSVLGLQHWIYSLCSQAKNFSKYCLSGNVATGDIVLCLQVYYMCRYLERPFLHK